MAWTNAAHAGAKRAEKRKEISIGWIDESTSRQKEKQEEKKNHLLTKLDRIQTLLFLMFNRTSSEILQ